MLFELQLGGATVKLKGTEGSRGRSDEHRHIYAHLNLDVIIIPNIDQARFNSMRGPEPRYIVLPYRSPILTIVSSFLASPMAMSGYHSFISSSI
jgi:hypothetical protein